ncbi:MAG: HNH endonuclease [bacterium]
MGHTYLESRPCAKCGKSFSPRKDNRPNRGRFCSVFCAKSHQFAGVVLEKHPSWTGGRRRHRNHMLVRSPGHPGADCHGYVAEYRLVAEKTHGRYLTREEVVHHINGDETDLDPDNLLVMENNTVHTRLHSQLQGVSYDLIRMGVIEFADGEYRVAGRIQAWLDKQDGRP